MHMKRAAIVDTVNKLQGSTGHQEVLRIYNSQKPLPRGYRLQEKDPWCAATVTAVFLENGCSTFAECSCPAMILKAKEAGIWQEADAYEAQPGDVIMYDWQDSGLGDNTGTADHTGIVTARNGQQLTVREGNKNGTLGDRQIAINSRYIRGYITPIFEDEAETNNQGDTLPMLRSGSKGKAVAVWQIIADAIPDGEFGTQTEKATRIFQQQHGLQVDGIVGEKTWAAGLKTL